MESSSDESQPISQPALPEVSSTPCFVVMDSQLEESQVGGYATAEVETADLAKRRILQQVPELNKGFPVQATEATRSPEMEEEEADINPTQDLFVQEPASKEKHADMSILVCTPSETIGSLHLSGGVSLVHETSTSGSSASPSVILPTPEAYGTVPVIIPSTPSGPNTSHEEPMDISETEEPIMTSTQKPRLKRHSTEDSEDAYRIPAWQHELNQEQQRKEDLMNSEDSWGVTSKQPSSSASLDSANPSSSLSEKHKSSLDSMDSWPTAQPQPMMPSTTDESTRASVTAGSRPPSTSVLKEGEPPQRPASAPVQQDMPKTAVRMTATSQSLVEKPPVATSQRHSGMLEKTQVGKNEAGLDIRGQPSTQDTLSKNGRHVGGESKEAALETDRQAIITGDGQALAEEAGEEAGGYQDPAPSQDWFLRLSPSQTQTQHRGTAQPDLPPREIFQQHEQHDDSKTVKVSGTHALAQKIVEGPTEHVYVRDDNDNAEKEGRSTKRLLSTRQATPWHAPASDVQQSEDAVAVLIPESEEPGITHPETDHGRSSPRRKSSPDPVELDQDSVFVEEDQWSAHGGKRFLGESEMADNSSPMAGFHLSVPKDGALLRPISSVTPTLLTKRGQRRSDRTPRHSTPIGDESEAGNSRGKEGLTSTGADVKTTGSGGTSSSTLVVSAVMEMDSADNSEIPEFHLERPPGTENLLKEAAESPSKKQTSVFSKVQEAKESSNQRSKKTKPHSHSSDQEDPFTSPKPIPFLRRRKKQDKKSKDRDESKDDEDGSGAKEIPDDEEREDGGDVMVGGEMDDSATIPVDYHEEEDFEKKDEQGVEEEEDEGRGGEHGMRREGDADEKMPVSLNEDDQVVEHQCEDPMDVSSDSDEEMRSEDDREKHQENEMENASDKGIQEEEDAVEMTILSKFIHSDTSEGTEKPVEQPEQQPSRSSTKKHVTIATEVNIQTSQPIRRDPYEFTDSQSNKTPTPMKTWTRKEDPIPREHVSVRNLDEVVSMVEPSAEPSTTKTSVRKRPERKGKTQTRASKRKRPLNGSIPQETEETAPSVTNQGRSGAEAERSPRKRHRLSEDRRRSSSSSSDKRMIPGRSPPLQQPSPWKIVRYKQINIMQRVREVEVRGEVVETEILSQEVVGEPIIEKIEHEFLTPSPTSKSSSSLTSGSLADVSSLGSRTSSSLGSMQKSISITSILGMAKSSSLSNISEAGSSLAKTISLPGSEKSSPNISRNDSSPNAVIQISPGETRQIPDGRSSRLTPRETGIFSVTSPQLGGRRLSEDKGGKRTEFPKPTRSPSRRVNRNVSKQPSVSSGRTDKEMTGSKAVEKEPEHAPEESRLRTEEVTAEGQVLPPDKPDIESRLALQSSEESEDIPCAQAPPKSSYVSPGDAPTEGSDTEGAEQVTLTKGDTVLSDRGGSDNPDGSVNRQEVVSSSSRRTRGKTKAQKSPTKAQTDDVPGMASLVTVLNTPPRETTDPIRSSPGETTPDSAQAFLVPGVRVFTRWLDGFYYPGVIKKEQKPNRLQISFDDGDTRVVSTKDVIIKDWLSVGQSVLAESQDHYNYPGIVLGYYCDDVTKETGYIVETDECATSRYPRKKVILSKDQAALLVTSCTSGSTGLSDISLDNLVEGKRQRSRLRTPSGKGVTRTPSKVLTKLKSPGRASPAVTRSGGKRKLVEKTKTESQSPRKRVKQLTSTAVASPDLAKQGTTLRRSPRKQLLPSTSARSPATSIASTPGLPSTPEMAEILGPLPSNRSLFKGIAFLLTQGEVKKRPKFSSDSSLSESDLEDVEEEVPFIKDYARRQIEAGGGVVLKDFDKSRKTQHKVYLIANTYCRTKKYFLALAVSMPCISHLWIRDCCRTGKLQNYRAYLLPAGESVHDNEIIEWKGNRCILSGLKVFLLSQYEQIQDTWTAILIAAGCQMVRRFPSIVELSKGGVSTDCDVLVTDPTCPRHVLHRAQQLNIPAVSVEWVMQCLITGQRPQYGSHHKFAWDYKQQIAK